MIVLGIFSAFLLGSIPFSLLIGRYALGTDIRQYGDGNPGATNVFRAGGKAWGIWAMTLDALKATVPVGISYYGLNWHGWPMVAIALAPVAGHMFSPFLNFNGGKAVAATFGMWIGLTIWEAPTVLGIMLFYWFKSVTSSGWAVILAILSLIIYLAIARPDPTLLLIAFGNLCLLAYKHRTELKSRPQLRYWLPFINRGQNE